MFISPAKKSMKRSSPHKTPPPPPKKLLKKSDVEEHTTKLSVSSYIKDIDQGREEDSKYMNKRFVLTEFPKYLRDEYFRRLLNPRVTYKSGKFPVYNVSTGALGGTAGQFIMVKDYPNSIAEESSDAYDWKAYESVRHAYGDTTTVVNENNTLEAAQKGGMFRVNANRQRVMFFGQMDNTTLLEYGKKVLDNSPLTALVKTYNSTTNNLSMINGTAITVRGQSRKIRFMNTSANTLIISFFEVKCIQDCGQTQHPIQMWDEGLTTSLAYDINPTDTTTTLDPSDPQVPASAQTIDGTTYMQKNKFNFLFPGMSPDQKGLHKFHQHWKVSGVRKVSIANGESCVFTQNHNGCFFQDRDHNSFYMEGISTGTIVTIQGKPDYVALENGVWQGITNTSGCGQFAMHAETVTYLEGSIPIIPDSTVYQDAYYKAVAVNWPSGSLEHVSLDTNVNQTFNRAVNA